ncbi:hypothetical protein F383_38315 [Gossypium arboreum]|nr:hypothetical protein F383_38315 [Gossypium arboreum]
MDCILGTLYSLFSQL